MHFRATRKASFSYFPKVAVDHRGVTSYHLLEFSWVMLQDSVQAPCNIYEGALCAKK